MNIEESLNKFFNKENFNSYQLIKLVEQAMNELPAEVLVEDSLGLDTGDSISDLLPTIKITEAWGSPGSKDRQIIEEFTSNIKGDTVEAKIQSLNNILSGEAKNPSLGEILATLLMIEVLNSILEEFTEAAGGFIFEGFLAGLFGGQAVQITGGEDDDTGAAGKPITDVRLGDKEYSLKLLGPGTDVKGSFKNMIEHFRVKNHVIYLDARRTGEGLQFGEFIITLDSFLDVFVTPFLKVVYKKEAETYDNAKEFQSLISGLSDEGMAIKTITVAKKGLAPGQFAAHTTFQYAPKTGATLQEAKLNDEGMSSFVNGLVNMDPEELQQYAPFKIRYAEAKFEGTKAEQLFGSYAIVEQVLRAIESGNKKAIFASLEKTPGWEFSKQFVFTKDQVEKGIKSFKHIGTLPISEAQLKKTWLIYGERLNATLRPVYGVLNMFTQNINSYFLGTTSKDKDRKQYGADAIKNTVELKAATDNAVKAVEGDPFDSDEFVYEGTEKII
tara:strand:+ start:2819 stop:4315 length:1497 start_codon:yes stop_codon:yes gene_type:complete